MKLDDYSNAIEHPASALDCPEVALQRVLARLTAGEEVTGTAEWEAVGAHLLTVADRDAQDWRLHQSEFIDAYVTEVIALLRRRPDAVARATQPWGIVVAKGRLAGRHAVGLEALGGLTGRDSINHRVRLSDVPRVVSLESLAEMDGVL